MPEGDVTAANYDERLKWALDNKIRVAKVKRGPDGAITIREYAKDRKGRNALYDF